VIALIVFGTVASAWRLAAPVASRVADHWLADSHPVQRSIAADIDADGDLDLIETNGALDLTVWVNDGVGHFTRQRPAASSGWDARPPGPSFETRAHHSAAFLLTEVASIRLPGGASQIVLEANGLAGSRSSHLRRRLWATTQAPRGPPSLS
jgi:hypothetical protein